MAFFQPVVFRLDNEKYGINISYVSGIEYEQTIVRVPNSSRNIKGIINLRGEVIPVLDLRTKFNMANLTAPKDAELIIINLPNNKIAIEVDGVEQIHHIDENDIVDMPEIAKSGGADYFDRVAKLDGKLIIIINPLELLSEEELLAVNELTADKAELNNQEKENGKHCSIRLWHSWFRCCRSIENQSGINQQESRSGN